jgi:hypothetical protein
MGAAIVVLIFSVILFFIFRTFVLWYWRVNDTIDVLKGMDAKVARLVKETPPPGGKRAARSPRAFDKGRLLYSTDAQMGAHQRNFVPHRFFTSAKRRNGHGKGFASGSS